MLSTDVVTRGTGRFGSPQKLSVAASALKPNPGIVADLAIAGTELVEGAVAANASGRPLFLLVGARPMSRDLGPGLTGDDVQQLEDALVRLGFDVGAVDGIYDEGTEAGVSAWYAQQGFAPFTATTDQLAAIRAREAELAAASVDVIAAADTVASAETAVVAARASVHRRGQTLSTRPGAPSTVLELTLPRRTPSPTAKWRLGRRRSTRCAQGPSCLRHRPRWRPPKPIWRPPVPMRRRSTRRAPRRWPTPRRSSTRPRHA